jgi:hypothetical protein
LFIVSGNCPLRIALAIGTEFDEFSVADERAVYVYANIYVCCLDGDAMRDGAMLTSVSWPWT